MIPTNYFRYVRRDTAAPCMVLQQYWTECFKANALCWTPETLETLGYDGKWIDIPTMIEVTT